MAGKNGPSMGQAWALGLEFSAAVGGFVIVGWFIDRYYGTSPWGLLICAGLGLVGGTYNMIRESIRAFRDSDSKNRGDRGE